MTVLLAAPPEVRWNYTYACNFNCTHCYTRAAWYPQELTSDANAAIAAQLVAAGVFVVGFGGGEVLLRRDCLHTIATLSDAGIRTVLTSNGWLLDGRRAAALAEAGLGWLKISLDSPIPAVHDAFRNRPGSFARVMRALDEGVQAGLKVYLSSVLTACNLADIDGFVSIAQQAGLAGISFVRFRPAGNGLQHKDRYLLTRDSLVELWRASPALQAWRARGGCSPDVDQPAPANPGAPVPLPLIAVEDGAQRRAGRSAQDRRASQ